jgi:hypothetical protein
MKKLITLALGVSLGLGITVLAGEATKEDAKATGKAAAKPQKTHDNTSPDAAKTETHQMGQRPGTASKSVLQVKGMTQGKARVKETSKGTAGDSKNISDGAAKGQANE